MRFEKFTNRLQQTLSDAQSLAMSKDHAAIEGIHILSTLMEEASNVSLLQQAGANLRDLQSKVQTALNNVATLGNPSADINISQKQPKLCILRTVMHRKQEMSSCLQTGYYWHLQKRVQPKPY